MSDYVFQEFPKWVTIGDNEPVLVQDAKEERKLKKSAPVEADPEVVAEVAPEAAPE